MGSDPAVFYLALVLPGLFGITLIIEGTHKWLKEKHEPAMLTFASGVIFLLIIIFAYFFVIPK